MKYYKLFITLLTIFNLFDNVFCDEVYEQISHYIQESKIIDPNSLYYNRQSQTIKRPKSYDNMDDNGLAIEVKYHESHYHSYCKDSPYEVFARRLINILIKNANLKINDGIATGKVQLEATMDQLEILKGFGEGKISIRQLDGIIHDIILQPEINLFDEALSYFDMFSFYLYEHRIIFGSLLLSILVILVALKVKWTRLRIIVLLFDIIVIISFTLTWWELLQEAEIKLVAQRSMYIKIPDECKQDEINVFKSIMLFFGVGAGNCLKYYEAVMTDPALKVTPLQAFMHMCSKTIFHPLSMLGTILSHFIDNLTNSLPFWLRPIVNILLAMLMPILLFTLLFVICGGAFGIRLGPFVHFYVHGRQSTPPSNHLGQTDRQDIEVIQSETQNTAITAPAPSETASVAKESLKTAEKSTETKIEGKEKEKQEESDTNSDEFVEDNGYEKISKKRIENEMNKTRGVEVIADGNSQKEEKKDESISRSKRSLEIGSGDC